MDALIHSAVALLWDDKVRCPHWLAAADAEDVKQEILCDLHLRVKRQDHRLARIRNMRAFLARSVRNKAAKLLRSRECDRAALVVLAETAGRGDTASGTEGNLGMPEPSDRAGDTADLVEDFVAYLDTNSRARLLRLKEIVWLLVSGTPAREARQRLGVSRATWDRRRQLLRDFCKMFAEERLAAQ